MKQAIRVEMHFLGPAPPLSLPGTCMRTDGSCVTLVAEDTPLLRSQLNEALAPHQGVHVVVTPCVLGLGAAEPQNAAERSPEPASEMDKLVSAERLLGILWTPECVPSLRWLRNMTRTGKIHSVKCGRRLWYVPTTVLEDLVALGVTKRGPGRPPGSRNKRPHAIREPLLTTK